ncbi:hypothetical protein [Halomarina rubra]|uniref:Uncharacterized protein n=1 Tax=Halomarina rubra TaxID=2071873 RepID=A0ABD6AW06_9EURY|nr:hypothetical protein [Halomarina rubra]
MRTTALLVAGLVVLAVLGGCLSGPPTGTDTTTETPTATPASTTTDTTTGAATPTPSTGETTHTERSFQECGYGLTVDVASQEQQTRVDRTVNYTALAPERQTEFQKAREDGSTDLGDDLPDRWGSPVIVRFEEYDYYVVASTC